MQFVSAAIVIILASSLALWPIAFLVGILLHAYAKRWRRVGQLAFLLPVWTIAASVGLTQLAPFVAVLDAPSQARNPFIPVVAVGLALCCAAVAWALLLRTFERRSPSAAGHGSASAHT